MWSRPNPSMEARAGLVCLSSSLPTTTTTGDDRIHVFWHDGMLNHDPGTGVFDSGIDPGFLDVLENHPENADRVKNMLSILKKGPLSPFISWHSGRPALISELLTFHTSGYINELVEADRNGGKMICAGTFLNSGSWDAALLAAGTTLSAMKHILDGHGKISYSLVRPPGHHAQPTQADGYCFLNNAGLAVQLALDSGCESVVVVDIDVHYGNGTAEGFYHSDKVLTISLHMNHGSWGPSHPHSGNVDELGDGDGFGYNLNIPLPNGTGDRGYEFAMTELVGPAVQKFQPDMMVLVIGQDSSAFDPNGRQCLTMKGYREIGRKIRTLADKLCDGRLLIVQEGGYQVTYSAYCLHATLEGEMDSSGHNSTAHSNAPSSTRGKSDPAWDHVTEGRASDGKKTLTCLYCGKTIKGGGINRMKQHLAGKSGEVGPCKKVPGDVRYRMEEALKAIIEKNKRSEESNPFGRAVFEFEDDVEIEEIIPQHNKGISINEGGGSRNKSKARMTQRGKGKESTKIDNFFAPRTTPGSQPTIKSALATKEAVHRAHMIVAKFLYDTCVPMNVVNSIYFQSMFDAAIAIGPGYKVPTYHEVRVPLLNDSKKELQLWIDSIKSTWADTGCTIMGDGWTDGRHRTLINFLVYCPRGTTFVKSVDASDVVKDAPLLCKLFEEIIEWVGVSNIVHMVTDNGANYVAAGRLVSQTYKNINWSPCAAHCLNLVLSDISKLNHVKELASRASSVTRFIYNRPWLIAWLRKRKGWTEIVRPGATRFATTFIALHSIQKHMHDLKALVTSKDFVDSRHAKDKKAKEVVAIILDGKFSNDCLIIVKIVEPLMKLLRIVDGDKKPSMGYVYEGMYRARIAIKNVFMKKKRLYKPYTSIIKDRWDRTLRKNIHAAAYWLNPAFQYNQSSFCKKPEVMASVLDVIETKATCSKTKLLDEARLFRDQLESFGRELATITSKTTQPDEWWRLFGHSAPNLQKLAIRILSQTSSSSGCERNWSVFERIHTKKRNRLEHQRLNDLVYIHYNLRLKNRHFNKMKNYDPVDIESIDKTEFWIVEDEEEPPLLDFDELEQMLYQESPAPQNKRQCHGLRDEDDEDDVVLEVGDDIDLGSFGDVNMDDRSNAQSGGVGTSNNENEDDDAWLMEGLPRN